MFVKSQPAIEHRQVELDGVRYVILRETVFQMLCRRARVGPQAPPVNADSLMPGLDLDRVSLAEKLLRRRRMAGLSQAELARQAGIRPETLNRIERGRTTPDFATIRKLVVAMGAAEDRRDVPETASPSQKETKNVD